jgi:hypothetical protein
MNFNCWNCLRTPLILKVLKVRDFLPKFPCICTPLHLLRYFVSKHLIRNSKEFFSGLQGLTKLRYLYLNDNCLIGDNILESLGELASLETIHFESCGMSGALQSSGQQVVNIKWPFVLMLFVLNY